MADARPEVFGETVRRQATSRFRCARPPLHWVGLLTPIGGLAQEKLRVDCDALTVGRDPAAGAVLRDESVSRHHARVRRAGDEFFLEDLGSHNGTYVDGVPVVSCVLHDGDTVQLGQNLYFFERLVEPAGRAEESGQASAWDGMAGRGAEGMALRFWGTRGSIPTPGGHTEKYGGNTTCLELRCQDTLVVFDAGSGIRALGQAWAREFAGRPVQAHLLFTHVHWDHIQGFPFFVPAYQKENAFTVYGEVRPDGGVRELLGGQMRGSYFPIPLSAMQADLTFRDTAAELDVGPLKVRTAPLPHPGGCLGYRVEAGGSAFVLATDCELEQVALNRDEVRAGQQAVRRFDPALLDFFRGASLLVIDCQYTDADYEARRNWGHNAVSAVVDLCAQARPDVVALFHHDPESGDEKVSALRGEVCEGLQRAGATDTLVLAARERMTLQVGKPLRPLSLSL